jgi:hypothetical protein
MFMLSFAGCNDDHTAPHDNQRCKYAEVEYGKYAKDGMYIAKGKYIECAKDGMYNAKGRYGEYAKEAASVEEGHNKPLAKKGDGEPLAKYGYWLGTTTSPLPQGQLAAYVMQDNKEPLTTKGFRTVYAVQGNNKPLATKSNWATTFDDHEGAKAPMVKLIMPIMIPHHRNKASYCLQ